MRKCQPHCGQKLLFILPALFIITVTIYVPLIYAFYLSLFGGRGRKFEYIGLGNYKKLMSDDMFLKLYPVKRTRERVTFEPTSPVYGR